MKDDMRIDSDPSEVDEKAVVRGLLAFNEACVATLDGFPPGYRQFYLRKRLL